MCTKKISEKSFAQNSSAKKIVHRNSSQKKMQTKLFRVKKIVHKKKIQEKQCTKKS